MIVYKLRKNEKFQTLIFNKPYYNSKRKIRTFINNNGFKILKYKRDPIRKYEKQYRVRQREPWRFNKKSLRTIKLTKKITAVVGKLK